MFRGVQSGRIDDKHRLKLPAPVKNRILEKYESGEVFITSLSGEDARLYPLAEWIQVEASLSERKPGADPQTAKRNKKLLFRANHFGADETLDNQGRILVPSALRDALGARSEVFLQWTGSCLLVLSAERYQMQLDEAALDDDDLAYADAVM